MRGLLIGLRIAMAILSVVVIVLLAFGRRSQARELATLILPNLLVHFRGLLRDPRVPLAVLRGHLDRIADRPRGNRGN